ncbi:MAG: hypothetical protein IPM69_06980 [Ignavibacteria bacterium]|nr:hypothetical protein [Ignavibacteria bacterium]
MRSAQGFVTQTINKGMVMLYWQIGKTIQEEVIKNDRAEYGKRIVQTLSEELVFSYGKGYSRSNLTRMMEFYKCFPDVEISATLSHQFPVRSVLICYTFMPKKSVIRFQNSLNVDQLEAVIL